MYVCLMQCTLGPRTQLVCRCALEAPSVHHVAMGLHWCLTTESGGGVYVCVLGFFFFRMMRYRDRRLDNYMLWIHLHFYTLKQATYCTVHPFTDTHVHIYPSFSWGHWGPAARLRPGGWGAVSVWKTTSAPTSPHSVRLQCANAQSCVHRHKHTNWDFVHQMSSALWDLRQMKLPINT